MKLAAATTAFKRLPITGESGPVLLELDLAKGISESPPATPIEALRSMHTPMLRTVVAHLRRAEQDATVAGLIAHVGNTALTLAQSEELRAAIARFRTAGKFTVAQAETFGEMAPDNVGYHLACAFEQIWLQPSGAVGLFGFSAQGLYLREALDKLQIVPQLGQRHEYKSAADLFMRAEMSEPVREMMGRLVDSAMQVLLEDVAADRGLSADAVRSAATQAPIAAQQALETKLIDRIGYRDQAYAAARERVAGAQLKYVERYGSGRLEALTSTLNSMPTNKPTIGVVQASGPVVLGRGGNPPMPGRQVACDRV
ncbi:MAG: signal peptidase, partial [Micrococcales bacterium]